MSFSVPKEDLRILKSVVERYRPRRVLEFGPGDSTNVLSDEAREVYTCEDNYDYYIRAKRRYLNDRRVTVLKYANEAEVSMRIIDFDSFDFAFVDGPYGGRLRTVHPGMEDCSRYNTLRYAAERCDRVLVHDANRPGERASIERICSEMNFEKTSYRSRLGMVLLCRA